MTLSPYLRLGNDALSHQAKRGVTPIEKPVKRERSKRGLARRTELKQGTTRLKKTPLGHASAEQKAKVEREGPRLDYSVIEIRALVGLGIDLGPTDPAHITPRPHGGCDSEHCICPLPRRLHNLYDEGKLDLLPWLTLEEQAHAASHLGLLGAVKRTTGEVYVPEREAVVA